MGHWQRVYRIGHRLCLAATTTLLLAGAAMAQRSTVFDLNHAVCANDWDRAIALTGQLVASDTTSSEDRQALLQLRRQMERYRAEGVLVADAVACNRTDPYFLAETAPAAVEEGAPLGWEAAVAEVTDNQYSTELITESSQMTLPVSIGNRSGLTPAQPVDLSRGLTVVSGHIGAGHNVYGFVAGLGDQVDIALDVTRVMEGTLYTREDSQLFVFDSEGNLLASSDDEHGTEASHVQNLVIPRTGLYFAVVTSYNNDPIFNPDGRLMDWRDNGGGRFEYTLSFSGATPTSALVR